MTGHILSIDQGTTNTKVLLINEEGTITATGSAGLEVTYPRSGWAETTGDAIWKSVETAIAACLDAAGDVAIAAIGISNQRESVLVWDRKTGNPIGPCIIWQCRRSEERLAPLRTAENERLVRNITGLSLDPLFPAAKIGWLLDNEQGARKAAAEGRLCAGTVDTYLLYRLTGGQSFKTDASNASRTQLFDISAGKWSPELCSLFDVPSALLAEICDSDDNFGETQGGLVLPAAIPIRAMIGDSHAALFAHGARQPGVIKATYGTGTSMMTLTEAPLHSENGLSTTVAWRRGGETLYALEGNITVSGQAAAFASTMLGLDGPAELSTLAQTVGDANGVAFIPALAGLGAPYWDASARGTISGLSLSTRPAHIALATLEAIAMQVCDVADAMAADLGVEITGLLADGGAAANGFLMQLQADLLGAEVNVPSLNALSGYGAGLVAGIATGLFADEDARDLAHKAALTFMPGEASLDRLRRRKHWRNAIEQARCPCR
ncbi:FGGY family carbohydrate kinase [Martelella radicis]|uniref:ATP:glycerol 3-phosphotransferase n=1 Tax=Martelella radicis TaxID=1397476 RepID=A0A7W6PC25_9HYPH|nr:FGGY family carbohydrate kinase [Martelella radicis]MBB4124525.1 glycerol kinase [Martelella radicis]